MSYVREVLQPGEEIRFRTNIHWFLYLPAIVMFIVGLAFALWHTATGSQHLMLLILSGLAGQRRQSAEVLPSKIRKRRVFSALHRSGRFAENVTTYALSPLPSDLHRCARDVVDISGGNDRATPSCVKPHSQISPAPSHRRVERRFVIRDSQRG